LIYDKSIEKSQQEKIKKAFEKLNVGPNKALYENEKDILIVHENTKEKIEKCLVINVSIGA